MHRLSHPRPPVVVAMLTGLVWAGVCLLVGLSPVWTSVVGVVAALAALFTIGLATRHDHR